MIYIPVQGHYFSSTGCKAVPAKINLFLWVEGQLLVGVFKDWTVNSEKEKKISASLNQTLLHGGRGTSQQAGSQWCNLQLKSAWTELRFKAVWAVRVSRSTWCTSNCELRRVGLYLKIVSLHCCWGGLIQFLGKTFPFLPSDGSKDSTFMFEQREELQHVKFHKKYILLFKIFCTLHVCKRIEPYLLLRLRKRCLAVALYLFAFAKIGTSSPRTISQPIKYL